MKRHRCSSCCSEASLARCASLAGCTLCTIQNFVKAVFQVSLATFVGFLFVVWLGAKYENWQVHRTPNTLSYYNQQAHVCGIVLVLNNNNNHDDKLANQNATELGNGDEAPSLKIETFESVQAMPMVGIDNISSAKTTTQHIVAHCGDCGACSTPHDINIYDATRNSLFSKSTKCAKEALIWGRSAAEACMDDSVGFTDECNDCWLDNIMCDLRKCVFTCIWYSLFQSIDNKNSAGNNSMTSAALNPCTECDERRCGPDFVTCAGANRRRSGIVSDIKRDSVHEVCHAVQPPDWWTDPSLRQLWEQQKQAQEEDKKARHPET